ncbi:hypothetical protein JQX13_45350 [Archangium violaceum]|uniref:hypothetical protein n=1 Tax=Archangium violaceum TaxID=83451 RepID=UPI00193BECCB|nr:hypothetical protein [Archangium violaceum]QRK07200.1 hypothetical protein JQX13_45350 [Archangium violaceum]
MHGDSLWVATDLGLDRMQMPSGEWTHYSPLGEQGALVETTCPALYEHLITWVRSSANHSAFANSIFQGLYITHPDFLRERLFAAPPRCEAGMDAGTAR